MKHPKKIILKGEEINKEREKNWVIMDKKNVIENSKEERKDFDTSHYEDSNKLNQDTVITQIN